MISIHAPREGCDRPQYALSHVARRFQSTHPVRGATIRFQWLATQIVISIHAPREGCDNLMFDMQTLMLISIHAPREGCDGARGLGKTYGMNFNPRTP